MELEVLVPLVFAGLFLLIDLAMFTRMIFLLKKHKDDSVDSLGNKLNPYLYASSVVSVFMAICVILMTVLK